MQWRGAGLGMLSLIAMTGCPEDFGKEGRIDRAVHRDVRERLQQNCSWEDFTAKCRPGREQSKECIEACGG
ncbi:hypothetical protein P2318_00530 [Myxococcaceae bacterium GXIMD 01537]